MDGFKIEFQIRFVTNCNSDGRLL